ncbi:MAG: hypothetical protein FD133_475 [Erysipelotrichaceae bacterium]|nr:MAG: hypothetical protein FD179_1414 [Erysipelotrichaceae bacterium]TXT19115.1 MAG: hypothetical protein FD133_475 [Erysipelotrichaceae bacterium]
MEDLGKLIGLLIIGLFVLEAFRFFLKLGFKKFGLWIKKNTKFHPVLLKMMKYNAMFHPWIGYLIVLLILTHVYIQTGFAWFSPSGLLAGILLSSEVVVGFVGQYVMKKPRPVYWTWVHRLLPVAIIVAILNHI